MSIISSLIKVISSTNILKSSKLTKLLLPVKNVSSLMLMNVKQYSSINPSKPITETDSGDKKKVKVIFKRTSGQVIEVYGKVGDTLLDVVVNSNVDIDGFGACEGTLSCSTCHLILRQDDFDRIKEKPTDEELDMLDLAYGLTDTSRLGCQIFLTQELDGLEVQIPEGINDVRIEPS